MILGPQYVLHLFRYPRELSKRNDQMDNADILDSRRNVFDNDEFDIFRNKNVDLTKVHIGKKYVERWRS